MNVLDRLKEKQRKHAEALTVLERLVLACTDPRMQLEGAAELHELNTGRTYANSKDVSELANRQV